MNRHQSKLELLLADANSGKSHVIYTEENKDYIEINDHWYFLQDKSGFLLTSEKDGFRHIYLYTMDGKLIRQVTSGKWEVTELPVSMNQITDYITFLQRSLRLKRNLYRIGLDGKNKICLTPKKGYNIRISAVTANIFVNRWSDINTPSVSTVNKPDGTEIRDYTRQCKA